MLKSIYLFRKWRNAIVPYLFWGFLIGISCLGGWRVDALEQSVNVVDTRNCDSSLAPASLSLRQFVKTVDPLLVQSFFPVAKGMILLSPVCEFDGALDDQTSGSKKSLPISLTYTDTMYRPRIYSWNEIVKKWMPLVSTMDRTTNTVSTDIEQGPRILAVFADGTDTYEGTASWYAHKRYVAGSATNLFPLGTKLKVTNAENNKSTIVTVTSTWTNKNEKRIIDLVSTAFKKIAKLGEGLIRVKIERVQTQ